MHTSTEPPRCDRIDSGAAGRWAAWAALTLTLVGFACAVALGWASDGFYHDDDVCHYLYARHAWGSTDALLSQWARPGYNFPTAVVARFFGMAGCRVFSAAQTAIVAWLAYLIAGRLLRGAHLPSRWATAAPALVWLQPLTMTLAATTLTETPAALYLALGLWLYLRGNRIWACAAFSVLFVTRYETTALSPILAAAVVFDARRAVGGKASRVLRFRWVWGCAAALIWAPAAYAVAAWLADVPPVNSPLYMFSRQYSQEYGNDVPYHFVSIWPQASGLGVLVCAMAGAMFLGRKAWMLTALTTGLVVLHSLLFWRGIFATGGYARFLVPLSGPVAALAAAGLAGLWRAESRRISLVSAAIAGGWASLSLARWSGLLPPVARVHPTGPLVLLAVVAPAYFARGRIRRWASRALAAGALLLAAAQVATQVSPMPLMYDPHHRTTVRAVRAMERSEYADRPGLTQHVLIGFFRPKTRSLFGNGDAIEQWACAEAGTLFFWDSKYCNKPHEPESTQRLYMDLTRLGRRIHVERYRDAVVEVFERREVPAPNSQTSPATQADRSEASTERGALGP